MSDLKEMDDFYGLRPSIFQEVNVRRVLSMRAENLTEIATAAQSIRNKMNTYLGTQVMYTELHYTDVAVVKIYQDYRGIVVGSTSESWDSQLNHQNIPLQYND